MKRRDFLKLSAAAASLPMLWIPGRARAATGASGRVKHLLVLYAKGGMRSHCLFNAVGSTRHNPWGVQNAASEWKLGAVCRNRDIVTTAGTIDGFAKRAQQVAVIPCVDHLPGGTAIDIDHRTASNRIGTGSPEGTVGLLTLIGQHHSKYAGGFSLSAVPPVEIGASEFGFGGGEVSRYRPISLAGEEGFTAATIQKGGLLSARGKLDARFLAKKTPAYRTRLEGFLSAKKNALTFADLLRDPRLDVINSPDAIDAGITNRELLEVLGSNPLGAIGDTEDSLPWGPKVALALRFFGFGSPACVVTNDTYDLHDNERDNLPPRSEDLVRQLAGLHDLLNRMPHPDGGSYWDATMVAVVSEFSRNNTLAGGFNSGSGSDHVEEESGPSRNQAIAVMGGAVKAGGKLIGSTDAEMNATGTVFSSRSLLSTFLDVIGMDHTPFWPDRPIEELFA